MGKKDGRRYTDLRARLLQEEMDRRVTSLRDQIAITATALDRRLEAMDEFRENLRDQADRMVPTDLFNTTIGALVEARKTDQQALDDRLKAVEATLQRERGRGQGITTVLTAVTLISTITALILLFVHLRA